MKTFKDTETGLEWLLEDFGPMTWKEAMALDVEGFKLPTRTQLLTLVDDSIAGPACSEPISILPGNYWTCTNYALGTTYAWYMYSYSGSVDYTCKTSNNYVRLVKPIKEKK